MIFSVYFGPKSHPSRSFKATVTLQLSHRHGAQSQFLNLADRMSKHGTVRLEIFSGVSVIGRSLGIKADRDFEDEKLGYDVIGFKSSYTAKVYAIPEWLVSGVSMY